MKISTQKVVTLHYKLQEANSEGEVIQEVNEEDPFMFFFGNEQVLPDFETHLLGKKTGDSFEFGIKSDDGYGPINKQAIVNLPRHLFEKEGELRDFVKVGSFVPMHDQENNLLQGLVKKIQKKDLEIDFNHPMAGIDLFFSGKVAEVREATEEEISCGHHIHAPNGHQH